jgi:cytochrome c biogenesis protein CcmG/thiol:disulfide interchange protein DsbE
MVRLSRQHLLPGLIGALTIAFLVSIWPSFRGAEGSVVQVGDNAPEFNLMSENGEPIQLKDFRGKFVVLNFWATWCPPCVEELPSLERFHDRFRSRGVVVLGVNEDDDRNVYRAFLQKQGVQFLTARDPERKVSHRYGTFKYPETYFIDRSGKVVQKIVGPANWNDPEITSYMEQLLRS